MAERRIEHKAARKQTLTLDEVAAFVQDAKNSGARGDEVVGGEVTIGGRLKRLDVDVAVPAQNGSHSKLT